MKTQTIEVKVGQVWKDNDKRAGHDRLLRVVSEPDTVGKVKCQRVDHDGNPLPVPATRIRVDRFRPTATGYVLVEQGKEQ